MASKSSLNAADLFGSFADQGMLSPEALKTLTVADLGEQIQAALGTPADAIEATEAFLVLLLLDDSTSIADCDNEPIIRDGVNEVIKALKGSKAQNAILMCVTSLNRGVIVPYTTIEDVPLLSTQNYRASGNTPLYDRTIEVLGTVLAKQKEFNDGGQQVRTATLIATDGADYGSVRKPRDVKPVVGDMLSRENHIICGLGIADRFNTDFTKVFLSMGLNDNSILTPKNTPSEIRKAFQVFSKSSVQASRGAQAFSKAGKAGLKP